MQWAARPPRWVAWTALVFTLSVHAVASAAPPAESAAAPLPPLAAEWLEPLVDHGFVSPPTGATEPRPIVIAVHGAGDRPDWACSEWRAIFGPVPFIVCPRGGRLTQSPKGPSGDTYAWASTEHVEHAIDAAVDAAAIKYAGYIDLHAPRVYVGFSQGARIGAAVVARAPSRYPVAVFLEGLGEVQSLAASKGTLRVLLACSQGGCAPSRKAAARVLERAGVEPHVLDIGPIGHTVNGRVIEAVRREVPWLLGDLAGWGRAREAVVQAVNEAR